MRDGRPHRLGILLIAAACLWLAGCGGGDEDPPQRGAISFMEGPERTRATLYAIGDGADGGSAARAVTRLVDPDRVDRLLYLGDVYENGTPAEFEDHYDSVYGRFRDITSPTPGNHEWPQHARGYDPYWDPPGGGEAPPYFYAVREAGWEIISLNSEMPHGPGSPQVRWLGEQLTEPGTCRLLFWHRPRYSASQHGDAPDLEPFWRLLRGHAKLVVNGHEHNYQRLRPVSGVTEVISGNGGHSLYPVDTSDPRLAAAWDSGYGALQIELESGRATFTALRVGAPPLERRTVTCTPLRG